MGPQSTNSHHSLTGESAGPPGVKMGPAANPGPPDDSAGSGDVTATLPPDADAVPDELAAYARQMRKRREASWRLPPLADGRHDPLDVRRAAS